MHEYRMFELNQGLQLDVTGKAGAGVRAAADYLETFVNEQAADGWEFYRLDTFSVTETERSGCYRITLGFFGEVRYSHRDIYVATFRRPKE